MSAARPKDEPVVSPGAARERNWAEHVQRITRGDHAALASLYDESGALLYRLALRMVGNSADAEEVVLEVFSHVWRSSASWDGARGTASMWLIMLCRSRCLDRLRSRRSRSVFEADWAAARGAHVCPTAEKEILREALDRLEPGQRELLVLAFFSGFTHAELADSLHLPLGTVKTRIRAAITKMRELLNERRQSRR